MKNIIKKIKQFFNLTGKEALICTIVVIITTILGVTAQFIGLFGMIVMAHAAYGLIKSPNAKNCKPQAIVMLVGCVLICIAGGALVYVTAGKAALAGSCASLFATFLIKEELAA